MKFLWFVGTHSKYDKIDCSTGKKQQRQLAHIKEPAGIDFVVDPTPLTAEDRKQISDIIAYYKATGRKMPMQKKSKKKIAA